ncbi:hypothetical protein HUG17_4030 [Dermatophagoides farinae]|uniref:Uncharacterized protein n=1 Tax=Dermatophagoides farinae TaxID=6954 RepID=A0A9D4SFD4_DERFA|nr:hypothetical protein HUG17_4030 [Dermatophagoides farinae]
MTTTSTNVAYISNQNEIDVNEHQMNDATTMKMKMMMMKNSTTINEQQPFDQDGFVGIELRLMRNLIILSFTSTMILGILQNLLTIDRYQYGQWTYIGFAIGFMFSALSVYYAQAFVQRFGPKRTLIISTVAIILFIFIHYFHNFILFQMAIILFTIFIGPFYAAQLEFISKFMSNLVHLTQTIKRYQEERYQRLLHQLLFCPSLIEYYQQQQQVPLEHRSYPSCSIRNVIFRTFRDNHLRLLLPMAFFIGFEQGFFMADYNKLYVSCALGLQAIGSIMLTRGFVHLGATLLVYEFIRHIQRPIVLLAGAICQLSVLAILYLWRPNDDIPLYYVITITYSLANAIMETLLLTNVLRTFCSDEWKYAFLTLYSLNNLGYAIAFAMSEFICLYIKLFTLILMLIIAIIPMQLCELRLLKFEKILGPAATLTNTNNDHNQKIIDNVEMIQFNNEQNVQRRY